MLIRGAALLVGVLSFKGLPVLFLSLKFPFFVSNQKVFDMATTSTSEGDVLHAHAARLVNCIQRINTQLAPLLILPDALSASENFLSVKVLNKFTNAEIGGMQVSGLMSLIVLPHLLEIVSSQTEALLKKRADLEMELKGIRLQLQALGTGDNGEGL
jgi:hypothetical protein